MFEFIKRPKIIFISLLIGLVCIYGFQLWRPHVGGQILDRVETLEDSSALLAAMTEAQKNSHFLLTLLIDYIFPVSYGIFFAGLALKFPGKLGVTLAIPTFIAFGTDIAENTVQLFALKGIDGLLFTKEFLTPVKFFFFNIAIYIASASLIWMVFKAVYARFDKNRA